MPTSLPINLRFLLLAHLWFGLGFCAILPPFEGYDEYAHYAYGQQLADTHNIPAYGRDRLSADAEQLRAQISIPYNQPPTGAAAPLNYDNLAAVPGRLAATAQLLRSPLAMLRSYQPAGGTNWEAQHPPLFYMLTAPLFKVTATASWAVQLFTLRATAFLIAWLGMLVAARALWNIQPAAAWALALLPVVLPEFFVEFARYGNDALCLCLFSLALSHALAWQQTPARRHLLSLGLWLGLGLLTKALFLPIAAGFLAWLILRRTHPQWRALACAILPALTLGSGWYLYKYLTYGSLVGADEFILLDAQGGLLATLPKTFSPIELAHGFATLYRSMIWAGSWSLVKMPPLLTSLLLILPAMLGIAGGWQILKTRAPAHMLGLFVLCPVLAGLGYHILVRIALSGKAGGTPGWYLLVLAPALALLAAQGWALLQQSRAGRIAGTVSVAYAGSFTIAAYAASILLYAGYLVPDAQNRFALAADPPAIWDQLAALAQPQLAAVFGAAALACYIAASMRHKKAAL